MNACSLEECTFSVLHWPQMGVSLFSRDTTYEAMVQGARQQHTSLQKHRGDASSPDPQDHQHRDVDRDHNEQQYPAPGHSFALSISSAFVSSSFTPARSRVSFGADGSAAPRTRTSSAGRVDGVTDGT